MNNVTAIAPETVFITVVGVVRDMRIENLVEDPGRVGTVFFPAEQTVRRGLVFALQTSGDPMTLASPVRAAIAESDRGLAVYNVQPMTARLDRSLATRRSPMLLAAAFGVVALLLSAIGVYGVLAYLVTQRTKEIGIRLALGSTTSAVFQMILREALTLVGVGFVAGLLGVFALKRSLDALLYDVSGADPAVLAAVGAMLAIAGALPARRATRISPVVALAE
jgi:ABC-type lipoprotein release transport system permease subunit